MIYELEERVFFDGALPVDVAETVDCSQDAVDCSQDVVSSEADQDITENVSLAPELLSSETESGQLNNESNTSTEIYDLGNSSSSFLNSAFDLEDLPDISEIYNLNSEITNQSEPSVLLLSTDNENFDAISASVNSSTIIVKYSPEDSVDTILANLNAELGDSKAVNIGIIESEKLNAVTDNYLSSSNDALINGLKEFQSFDGEIDFIGTEFVGGISASNLHLTEFFDTDSSQFNSLFGDLLPHASTDSSTLKPLHSSTNLYFIDHAVEDTDILIAEIPEDAVIVELNEGEGIDKITEVVNSYGNIDEVHILSQGNYAQILLGGDAITKDNITNYQEAFSSWNDNLSQDADILFYGCDVAKEAAGKNVLNQIAEWTGADIAASTDITGGVSSEISIQSDISILTSEINIDWDLEYTIGSIEASAIAAVNYNHHLETYTVTEITDNGTGTVEGSLSWAVEQANATTSVDDTINFNLSAGSTITVAGNILVTDDLTINGNGVTITFENSGNGLIFDDNNDNTQINITINDLTVETCGNTSHDAEEDVLPYVSTNENLTISNSNINDIGYVFAHIPSNIENTTDLYIIDSAVQDINQIIGEIPDTATVIALDEGEGINSITRIVTRYSNISSLHVISEGNSSQIFLGGEVHDLSEINDLRSSFESWNDSLSENADILFYGCRLAQNEDGKAALSQIAEWTGADVAASTDVTGSSMFGDWDLEYNTGTIETASISVENYNHVLDTATAWFNELYFTEWPHTGYYEIVIEEGTDINSLTIASYDGSCYFISTDSASSLVRGDTINGFTFYATTQNYNFNGEFGWALLSNGTLISGQFIADGEEKAFGPFTAIGGPVNGTTATDLNPDSKFPITMSLTGTGSLFSDFSWNNNANRTYNTINDGQALINPSPSVDRFNFSTIADGRIAGQNFNTTISAVDSNGDTVTDYTGTVNLTVNSGSISDTSITFTNGTADLTAYVTAAGSDKITATDQSDPSITGYSNNFTVTAGAVNSVTIATGDPTDITAGDTVQFTATAKDAYNNTITTDVSAFTWNETSSQVTTTFSNGLFDDTTADVYTVFAAYNGTNSANTTITVTPGDVASVNLTAPTPSIQAGNTETLAAEAYDQYGNLISNSAADFTWTNTAAVDSALFNKTTAQPWAVTADYNGTAAVATITVTPGAVDVVALTAPSPSIQAGNTETLTAEAYDQYGNLISNSAADFTWTNTAAAASALFNKTTAQPWAVTADYNGTAAVATITVTPGAVADVTITALAPTDITAGDTVQFAATAQDAYNNTITTDISAFTWNESGPQGVSTFNNGLFNDTTAGAYTVYADYNGTNSINTIINVNPGAVDAVALTAPSPSIQAGNTETLTAEAYDQYGNLISNSAADFTWINTAAADSALFNKTTAQPWAVTAEYSGITDTTDITVTPGAVATVIVTAPSPSIQAGSLETLTAYAVDMYGNLVTDSAADFTWTNTAAADSALFNKTTAQLWTVAAEYNGTTDTTEINVTPGAVDSVALTPSISQTLTSGDTVQFSAIAKDAYSNTITSSAPAFTWNNANSDGLFINSTAGSYNVTAMYGAVLSSTVSVVVNTIPTPQPSVDNGMMINDSTQIQTQSSWRDSIDNGPQNDIDSNEGEMEDISLMTGSLSSFDFVINSVGGGAHSIGSGVTSAFIFDGAYGLNDPGTVEFSSGEHSIGGDTGQVELADDVENEFGAVDLAFDFDGDDSGINFEGMAVLAQKHPTFKTELDLLLEKI